MHILPKRTMVGYIAAHIEGGNVLDLGCGDGHAMESFPTSSRRSGSRRLQPGQSRITHPPLTFRCCTASLKFARMRRLAPSGDAARKAT